MASIAVLNLSVPGDEFACGPCTVLPLNQLFAVPTFAQFGPTQSATQSLSLPCKGTLAGATLAFQWLVLPTAATPCALGPNIALSNRQHLTLGF